MPLLDKAEHPSPQQHVFTLEVALLDAPLATFPPLPGGLLWLKIAAHPRNHPVPQTQRKHAGQ